MRSIEIIYIYAIDPQGFRGYRVHPNYLLAKLESAYYNRVIRTSVRTQAAPLVARVQLRSAL